MDHPRANESPYRRIYATLFRAIHATSTSRFLRRIIVFAVGRSGAAGAKKINFAEIEQICRDSNDYDYQNEVKPLAGRVGIGSQITFRISS